MYKKHFHFQTRKCPMVWLLNSSRRLLPNPVTTSVFRLVFQQSDCLLRLSSCYNTISSDSSTAMEINGDVTPTTAVTSPASTGVTSPVAGVTSAAAAVTSATGVTSAAAAVTSAAGVTSAAAVVTSAAASVTSSAAEAPRADYPWRRAKKVAAMLSFSGKDYFGMQRNPGMRTIEEELMAAFRQTITTSN
jgi:hypothetical protein